MYDLIIVGGGPAGLSAAINAGSEGLHTLLVDKDRLGGQAKGSARIENLLGFPVGLSGQDLIDRAVAQATRFGVDIQTGVTAKQLWVGGLDWGVDGYHLTLNTSFGVASGKAALLALGGTPRDTELPKALAGQNYTVGRLPKDMNSVRGEVVGVIGGGNSAGQAALALADYARKVRLYVRRPLRETMSAYLIELIEQHPRTYVYGFDDLYSPPFTTKVFVFTGSTPAGDWLPMSIDRDDEGYVVTEDFQTSLRGVFAAGDIRSGSVKRVASAVGEGAAVISHIHKYLRVIDESRLKALQSQE